MSGSRVKIGVLFVCTGNICRSPTAEGVFRAMVEAAGLADDIEVNSAGTSAYHTGEPPDERAQMAAHSRGIDLSTQRARQVDPADFDRFDFVVAMDRTHHRALLRLAPEEAAHRVRLFLEYAPQTGTLDVPDPSHGGVSGFDHVFDLIEAGSTGLLRDVRAALKAVE